MEVSIDENGLNDSNRNFILEVASNFIEKNTMVTLQWM